MNIGIPGIVGGPSTKKEIDYFLRGLGKFEEPWDYKSIRRITFSTSDLERKIYEIHLREIEKFVSRRAPFDRLIKTLGI
jgi:hypothetical protein